jgi:peptidoglycan/LPS O-acetylase OafA/YrhL
MVGSDIVKKDYFKRIDYIRIIACIAILLYHLNILKGGYLAVCTFFVLTGYLAVISAVGKEKFSLKEYYFNKFKKIYLPLLVVVFSSVAVISLLSFINWLNLKPETTSVLLGYNNYWQLNANLDYFVRHISSPFMHLWYIAILLQFELVFPIVYLIFKKVKEKIGKIIPCLFFLLLGLLSYLLFFITINDGSIMQAYYGTFTRAYSLLFGVFLGFVHAYYSPLIFKNKSINRVLYCFYHLLLVLMYIFVDVDFCSFNLSMIIATVISMRLIDYSTIKSNNINLFDKIIKSLSNVSYEVYLVQYPIIFVLQSIKMNSILRTISVISLTIIISYIIKYAVTFKKSKLFVLKILVSIAVFSLSIFGVYKYIVTEDHTKEMKRLEEKLNENSKLIEQQKQEYLEKKKNEEDEWQKELNDLSLGEEELKEKVKNMSVVGIGDSIMELAVRDLYKQFPNGYFDAKTNRTEHELNGILRDLRNKDMLPDVIVLNIGTNGGWSKKIKDEM